jgi:hypothetical protein
MANTQNYNNNANENNVNSAANNPPPPLTLEQVLIMQAHMLQTMQQTMANMQQAQGHLSHLVLRPKLDAHRMYTQDQVVIHMARM